MQPTKISLADRLVRVTDVVFEGNGSRAAEAAGLAQAQYHRLLTGGVTNPRLRTIQGLAEAFGVSLTWLLGEQVTTPLAEPFWLLISYYRGVVQARRRDALQVVEETFAKRGTGVDPVWWRVGGLGFKPPVTPGWSSHGRAAVRT
jgi:transcriptional regulator with XRE-family HTH domain